MRIITTYFDPGPGQRRYDIDRLLAAYKASARYYKMPLEVVNISPPAVRNGRAGWMDDNTAKLHAWRDLVYSTDEPLILTDADMIFLQHFTEEEAFAHVQDIAVTYRTTQEKMPLNGGVFFVRPNGRTRDFMRLWCDVNDRMLLEHDFHDKWKDKYSGMNQAALGYILETGRLDCHMHVKCCREWNGVDEDWPFAGSVPHGPRLLHIKGRLRKICLNPKALVIPWDNMMMSLTLWQYFDWKAQQQ